MRESVICFDTRFSCCDISSSYTNNHECVEYITQCFLSSVKMPYFSPYEVKINHFESWNPDNISNFIYATPDNIRDMEAGIQIINPV